MSRPVPYSALAAGLILEMAKRSPQADAGITGLSAYPKRQPEIREPKRPGLFAWLRKERKWLS